MDRGPFRIAAATALVLTLLILGSGEPAGARGSHASAQVDWTQDRFDAAHDGFNPFETKIRRKTVANLRFGFVFEGNFLASPIEVSGIVDLPYSGRIDAITPFGAPVWSRSFKGGVVARPAGGDGTIYVPGPTTLYEVDALTGAVTDTWKNTPSSGEPVLTNDSIYVHTTSELAALDRQSHLVRWRHTVTAEATPAVSGGLVYEPISSTQLEALNASTGAVMWGPVTSSGNPAVGDGMVFTNGGGALRAFDALTGKAAWSASLTSNAGIPAVANGTIYTTIGNPASLEAFDDATGTPKWTIKLSKGAAGTAITLTNELVFASTQRGVFVLNKRGIVLNKLTTYLAWSGGSHATVVNGHVFFYGCGKRCAFAGWGV